MKIRQRVNGKALEVIWNREGESLRFASRRLPEATDTPAPPPAMPEARDVDVLEVEPGIYSVIDGVRSYDIRLEHAHYGDFAQVGPWRIRLEADSRSSRKGARGGNESGRVLSAMPGRVVKVLVAEGEAVEAGRGLVVLEAMKMQNEIAAPRDGVVHGLAVSEGDVVAAGVLLCRVE